MGQGVLWGGGGLLVCFFLMKYLITEHKILLKYLCVLFLREDMEKAKSSGDWKAVLDFYSTTFDSFLEINAAFKVDTNS